MRLRVAMAGLTAAVLATAAAGADKPSDEDITRLLVGAWAGSAAEGSGTIRYAEKGTYTGEATVRAGKDVRVTIEGTWKVSGGSVLMEITKSSHPGLAPVGTKVTEVVKGIDDTTYRFVRGRDKERERKRVKE